MLNRGPIWLPLILNMHKHTHKPDHLNEFLKNKKSMISINLLSSHLSLVNQQK